MTIIFILLLAVLVAIPSLLWLSYLMFPDDDQADEHATMHLWAPRCCPPCDGKCQQGRDCPADKP